jgi:hypoxanthine-DNA glycosylase
MVLHNIPPVYDKNSKILILGSFPSVASRDARFFYAHPQNRFWKVLSMLTDSAVPVNCADKKNLLLKNNIALWDVLASCEINASSDSSIKNAVPNDLSIILNTANIKAVFCNGTASYKYYQKYTEKLTGIAAVKLPSTSPANAAYSLERLNNEWEIIKRFI